MRVKPSQQPPQEDTQLLEINLISAQNLKPPPSSKVRRMQTYAVVYINSNSKFCSRIDCNGDENPTWNDKFIFRVSRDFLYGETSAVNVDIFAVGVVTDVLLGSVRLLLCHVISPASHLGVPSFVAVQVRRPSGRYHGVLNVGAAVIDVGELKYSLSSVSAIGHEYMMGLGQRKMKRRRCVIPMGVGRLFRSLGALRMKKGRVRMGVSRLRRLFRVGVTGRTRSGFRLKKGRRNVV